MNYLVVVSLVNDAYSPRGDLERAAKGTVETKTTHRKKAHAREEAFKCVHEC